MHASLAWGYIRVSGDEQADRGLPVAGQRERIQEHAEKQGGAIARWFVDEARPGSSDAREQFQLMMRIAHQDPPPVTTIVIWSWSRFARDQDDAHYWKASLRRHGVQIVSVEDAVPQGTGMDYVFEALIHWKDERRLEEIGHDARRGQQTLARMGYIPSGCEPPRGYRVEFETGEIEGRRRRLRHWVLDPDIAPIVRRAWDLRLAGESYKAIIRETGLYKSPGCFPTFYANTAYKGIVTFGETRIPVAPIVTEAEWARVQSMRQVHKSGTYARRKASRFLLSGLVRCGHCGGALVGDHSGSGRRNDGYARRQWDLYRCNAARYGDCTLPLVGADQLEAAVLEYVDSRILQTTALTAHWQALEAMRDAERPALEAQLAQADAELAGIRRQIENLLRVIEDTGNATVTARLSRRELDAEAAEAQIAALRAHLGARPPLPDVDAIREQLHNALEHDRPAARELLKVLVMDVTVTEDSVLIRGKLPGF
ncbi:MAG: recombinase family protein [Candidatus Paceibacterota bacterium]|jgi:DNA invertase Pin-like site-specific DNA recombinase